MSLGETVDAATCYRAIAKPREMTDRMRMNGHINPAGEERLNPIFEYAAIGQHHERRKEWALSAHWYHRSLACLPNLFGSDKKIRPLDLPYPFCISFRPMHACRIYSSLGRVLQASGHKWDSLLAFQATEALGRQYGITMHPEKREIPMPDSEPATVHHLQDGLDAAAEATRLDVRDWVTLIMVTHCTPPLKKNASLSPPSNNLVAATFGSMLRVFGDDIAVCPKIMCCDVNPNGSGREARYTQSIEHFAQQNGFVLRRFPGIGLFNVLNQIIHCVDTPYIFFAEHDWMFRGEQVRLPALIQMMEDEPHINAIRFNKRQNYLNGQDFLMKVDSTPRRYPLMRTSSFSNNPTIFRTEKLKREWLPICERSLSRVTDRLGGSAFGIEEILFKTFVQEIRAKGFTKAHEKWGTYVFGAVGDAARIIHLGE